MVKFTLVACAEESGIEYVRKVKWPLVPRQGEMIDIAGDMAPVEDVYHCEIDSNPSIQVHCNIGSTTEQLVKANSKWKKAGR